MHSNWFSSHFLFDTLWWLKMQDNFKRLLCGLVAMVIEAKDIKSNFKLFWTQIKRNCSNFSYAEFKEIVYKNCKILYNWNFFYRQMNFFINLPWLLNSTSKIQFFHLIRTKIVFNEKNQIWFPRKCALLFENWPHSQFNILYFIT